ncbi:unknown [Salmonella phage FelixO1]|uniref:Uncharacterized protein n=1 Tax=Salmonella phage Felix O1 (isolate Felix O1-VT1) TaxID=1283336 RepID=Q6KGE3_BPFO1|nr:unknown [Salmonella phage FelixO1]
MQRSLSFRLHPLDKYNSPFQPLYQPPNHLVGHKGQKHHSSFFFRLREVSINESMFVALTFSRSSLR